MDNNILLIGGGILLAISALLIFHYFRAKAQLNEMWAVKTYDARELKRMCGDGFGAVVEVQGAVSCDKPIMSAVSRIPCCWYRLTVSHLEERQFNVLEWVVRMVSRKMNWVTDTECTYSAVFKVEDKTGTTLVYPEGAEIDSMTAYNGMFSQDEPWLAAVLPGACESYHVKEEVFLPTGYAYVLGQASPDGNGNVLIRHPDRGYIDPDKSFFIISRDSERDLSRRSQITVNVCLWFGVAFLLLGAFFLAEGLGVVHVLQRAAP